ncbi:MAG TPA: DUF1801 domain-containing protein [Vicinamibacterales bacterium]|nr:DUF1801 domain-containing protein [Vicinamibacterales bacterium]
MTANDFRRIALGMEGAIEGSHMGHPDFRLNNRIFASLHHDDRFGMVKLTPEEQKGFLRSHPSMFEPESGAWGLQGYTRVHIDAAEEDVVGEAMTLAWRGVASKPLARVRSTSTTRARRAVSAKPVRAHAHAVSTRTFKDLVAPYPREVQALARAARSLVLDVLPKVEESVDPAGPYISYGYGPGYKGVVSYITVSQKGVKLGVARGPSLPDPKKLLRGTGKSGRHVVINTPDDLRTPGLRQLIRAALAAWKKERT